MIAETTDPNPYRRGTMNNATETKAFLHALAAIVVISGIITQASVLIAGVAI